MNPSEFKEIENYRTVIFDLDNTLYDECDYLYPAYQKISRYISEEYGGKSEEYYRYLTFTFQHEGRKLLFSKLLIRFNMELQIDINIFLTLLRDIKVKLHVYERMKLLLHNLLSKQHKIYILTNGNITQQQNKIASLDIQELLPSIQVIYADEYIPKPSPYCIDMIIKKEGIERKEVVLIGDSSTDRQAACYAGIDFIHVKTIIGDDSRR